MRVEAEYTKEVISGDPQEVQCMIPGVPDSPEIWTRSVGNSEFVIEWGEPRLCGVKLRGYQVYINGKKVGNALSSHHRKAVIPCKARRSVSPCLMLFSAANILLMLTDDGCMALCSLP